MMKKIEKILCSILMVSIMISGTVFASDATNLDLKEQKKYEELKKEGVLGEDVSYNEWRSLNEESKMLEKSLTESTDFIEVYSTPGESAGGSYNMKTGDVFITNGTSSSGLTGHSGIAISTSQILHIAGPGKTPKTISLSAWNSGYSKKGWTRVYRHSNSKTATAAGNWASKKYKGSSAKYKITSDLTSTKETYCSKIVWQAYYYGPSSPSISGTTTGIKIPYGLPNTIKNIYKIKTFG